MEGDTADFWRVSDDESVASGCRALFTQWLESGCNDSLACSYRRRKQPVTSNEDPNGSAAAIDSRSMGLLFLERLLQQLERRPEGGDGGGGRFAGSLCLGRDIPLTLGPRGLGYLERKFAQYLGPAAPSPRRGAQQEPGWLRGFSPARAERERILVLRLYDRARSVTLLRLQCAGEESAPVRPVSPSIFPALQVLSLEGTPAEYISSLFPLRLQLKALSFERAPLQSLAALLGPPGGEPPLPHSPSADDSARNGGSGGGGSSGGVGSGVLALHGGVAAVVAAAAPQASPRAATAAAATAAAAAAGGPLGTGQIPAMHWSRLEALRVSFSALTELDASLRRLPRLREATLTHNELERVDFLQDCACLERLDLGFNRISSCAGWNALVGNLVSLVLRNNRIRRTHGLDRLYSLEFLDLSYNDITALREVTRVGTLPCLSGLALFGNPVEVRLGRRYRLTVLGLVRQGAARVPGEGGWTGCNLALDGRYASKAERLSLQGLQFCAPEMRLGSLDGAGGGCWCSGGGSCGGGNNSAADYDGTCNFCGGGGGVVGGGEIEGDAGAGPYDGDGSIGGGGGSEASVAWSDLGPEGSLLGASSSVGGGGGLSQLRSSCGSLDFGVNRRRRRRRPMRKVVAIVDGDMEPASDPSAASAAATASVHGSGRGSGRVRSRRETLGGSAASSDEQGSNSAAAWRESVATMLAEEEEEDVEELVLALRRGGGGVHRQAAAAAVAAAAEQTGSWPSLAAEVETLAAASSAASAGRNRFSAPDSANDVAAAPYAASEEVKMAPPRLVTAAAAATAKKENDLIREVRAPSSSVPPTEPPTAAVRRPTEGARNPFSWADNSTVGTDGVTAAGLASVARSNSAAAYAVEAAAAPLSSSRPTPAGSARGRSDSMGSDDSAGSTSSTIIGAFIPSAKGLAAPSLPPPVPQPRQSGDRIERRQAQSPRRVSAFFAPPWSPPGSPPPPTPDRVSLDSGGFVLPVSTVTRAGVVATAGPASLAGNGPTMGAAGASAAASVAAAEAVTTAELAAETAATAAASARAAVGEDVPALPGGPQEAVREFAAYAVSEHLLLYFQEVVFNSRCATAGPYLSYASDVARPPTATGGAPAAAESLLALFRETALLCNGGKGHCGGCGGGDGRSGTSDTGSNGGRRDGKAEARETTGSAAPLVGQRYFRRDAAGAAASEAVGEAPVLVVVTDAAVYLVDEAGLRGRQSFAAAPRPRALARWPLAALGRVVVGFRAQTLRLYFLSGGAACTGAVDGDDYTPTDVVAVLTRDRQRTYALLRCLEPLATDARRHRGTAAAGPACATTAVAGNGSGGELPLLLPAVDVDNDDDRAVDGVALALGLPGAVDAADVACYELLFQRWEERPWLLMPRTLVVASGKVALCDDAIVPECADFNADIGGADGGADCRGAGTGGVGRAVSAVLSAVDVAPVRHVREVQQDGRRPERLRVVLRGSGLLADRREWLLQCRTAAAAAAVVAQLQAVVSQEKNMVAAAAAVATVGAEAAGAAPAMTGGQKVKASWRRALRLST